MLMLGRLQEPDTALLHLTPLAGDELEVAQSQVPRGGPGLGHHYDVLAQGERRVVEQTPDAVNRDLVLRHPIDLHVYVVRSCTIERSVGALRATAHTL